MNWRNNIGEMFALPAVGSLVLLLETISFSVARPRVQRQIDLTAVACSSKAYLKSLSGTLSSPNYPNSYPPNSTCTWIIEGQVGQIIRIQFESLDVISSSSCGLKSCKCDRVHLREPGSVDPARIKGKYCNTVKPAGSFTTTGHRLRVVFYSDDTGEGKGFSMSYEILDSPSNTTVNATRSNTTTSPPVELTTTTTSILSTNESSVVPPVSVEPTTGAIPTDTEGPIPDPTVVASIAAKRKTKTDRIQITSLDEPAVSANSASKDNGTVVEGGGAKKEEDPPDIVILGPSVISVLVFVGGVLGIAYHNYRENQKEKNRYERYERLSYRRPITGAVVARKKSKKKQKQSMREIRTHKLYSDMAKEWKDHVNIPPRKQSGEQSTWNSYMEAKRKKSLGGRLRELAEKPVHFIQTHTPRPSRPQSVVDPDKNAIPLDTMGARPRSGFLDPGGSTSRPASVLLRDALHMIFAAGLSEGKGSQELEAESQPLIRVSPANEDSDGDNDVTADVKNRQSGPMDIPSILVRQPSEDSDHSQTLESPTGKASERPPKYEDIAKPQRRGPSHTGMVPEVAIPVEDEPFISEEKEITPSRSRSEDDPGRDIRDEQTGQQTLPFPNPRDLVLNLDQDDSRHQPAYTCADHVRDILRESYGDDDMPSSWRPQTVSVPEDFVQMVRTPPSSIPASSPKASVELLPQVDHVDDVD